MKIIFLDMDGVMLSFGDSRKGVRFGVTNTAVEQLNRIIDETKAEIVLSSTWRLYYPIEEMQKLFDDNGCKANIISYTPDKYRPGLNDLRGRNSRGRQIEEWLEEYPKISSFAVVDDDVFDIIPLIDPGKVVKIKDPVAGLMEVDANKIIEILK